MLNLHYSRIDTQPYQNHALENFPDICRPRSQNSHKGIFGNLAVIGGKKGMTGAALLAGTAALYCGCGKVFVGLNQMPAPPTQAHLELMVDSAPNILVDYGLEIDTWVVGCGLGSDEMAFKILHTLWHENSAQLVLDADALSLLVLHSNEFPHTKRVDLVLTPHPGEAAQLLDTSITQIENNRPWAARELASRYRAWVVLKGHKNRLEVPWEACFIGLGNTS